MRGVDNQTQWRSGVARVLRAPVQRHVTGRLSPPSNKAVKQFICFLQLYM